MKDFDINSFNDFPADKIGLYTQKQELAAILKIHKSTVQDYHDVALKCIPAYEADFPKINEGRYNTRSSLTRYQVWIIWLLKKLVVARNISKKDLVTKITDDRAFAEQFEEEKFIAWYQEHYDPTPNYTEDEYQGLLQIAQNHATADEEPVSGGLAANAGRSDRRASQPA